MSCFSHICVKVSWLSTIGVFDQHVYYCRVTHWHSSFHHSPCLARLSSNDFIIRLFEDTNVVRPCKVGFFKKVDILYN